jgi:hypothetical protein
VIPRAGTDRRCHDEIHTKSWCHMRVAAHLSNGRNPLPSLGALATRQGDGMGWDGTRARPAIPLALPDPSIIMRRRHPAATCGRVRALPASAFVRGAPAGHPRFEHRGTGAGPARVTPHDERARTGPRATRTPRAGAGRNSTAPPGKIPHSPTSSAETSLSPPPHPSYRALLLLSLFWPRATGRAVSSTALRPAEGSEQGCSPEQERGTCASPLSSPLPCSLPACLGSLQFVRGSREAGASS